MFEDFFFSLISILNPKYVNEDKIHFYLYNMTIFKLLPLVLFLLTLYIYSLYKKMYKIVFRRIGYFLRILRFYIVLPGSTAAYRLSRPRHRAGTPRWSLSWTVRPPSAGPPRAPCRRDAYRRTTPACRCSSRAPCCRVSPLLGGCSGDNAPKSATMSDCDYVKYVLYYARGFGRRCRVVTKQ